VCDSEENLDTRLWCEPVVSHAPILRGINTVYCYLCSCAAVQRHTLVAPLPLRPYFTTPSRAERMQSREITYITHCVRPHTPIYILFGHAPV
jgi:hypothetical protein